MKAIRLNFRGEEYLIPANQAFEAGAEVEEIVTLGEIGTWGNKVPFFKVAKCYGALLRYAGCVVTDEAVFGDIMADVTKAGEAKKSGQNIPPLMAVAAINMLAAVLMNGAPEADEDAATPEKPIAS